MAGGCIYADAPPVVTSDVVTIRLVSMQPHTQNRQSTPSFAVSSPARIGFGITEPTNTPKGLPWHPQNTIRSTNPYPDQPGESRPTGKTCWWGHDDASTSPTSRLRRLGARRSVCRCVGDICHCLV